MTIRITRGALDAGRAFRELEGPGAGGVVVFVGRVRPDRTRSGVVTALDYEADPAPAVRVLEQIAATAARRWGTTRTVLWHRTGRLRVGVASVIAGAAAPHRAEAFAAARFLIEQLKRQAPIWKTERARPGRPRRRPPGRRPGR
jgi:molybdopterin synthase catalytic subunit